jgi:dipeptidase E
VAVVAVWREFGFDAALREAYEGGTVLAGISAGANCWFERYVTDSVPGGGVREGLGLLPGTFCPHLDSEPWRPAVLRAEAGPAWGATEGVLVQFDDERAVSTWHDRPADRTPVPNCRRRAEAGADWDDWPPQSLR